MESLAESMREQSAMPRFENGSVNLRELMRRIAEDVVSAINSNHNKESGEGCFTLPKFQSHSLNRLHYKASPPARGTYLEARSRPGKPPWQSQSCSAPQNASH